MKSQEVAAHIKLSRLTAKKTPFFCSKTEILQSSSQFYKNRKRKYKAFTCPYACFRSFEGVHDYSYDLETPNAKLSTWTNDSGDVQWWTP